MKQALATKRNYNVKRIQNVIFTSCRFLILRMLTFELQLRPTWMPIAKVGHKSLICSLCSYLLSLFHGESILSPKAKVIPHPFFLIVYLQVTLLAYIYIYI